MTKVGLILLAGGIGTRTGFRTPKQFIRINGLPMFEIALPEFLKAPLISSVSLVVPAEHVTQVRRELNSSDLPELSKVQVVAGGASRFESGVRGAKAHPGNVTHFMFHDAARPFVSREIIESHLRECQKSQVCNTAITPSDSISRVLHDERIVPIVRSELFQGQTPQTIERSLYFDLVRSVDIGEMPGDQDECSLIAKLRPDEKQTLIAGSPLNFKITFPGDLLLAEALHAATLTSEEVGGPIQQDKAFLASMLKGKHVVIFGGTGDLGSNLDQILRDVGARTSLHSRTLTGVDIQSWDDVERALESSRAIGPIDHVVVAVGQLISGSINSLTRREVEIQLAVNLLGGAIVSKSSYPFLRETHGSLLLTGSSSQSLGRKSFSLYSAAKAGTLALGQALASEWEDVRVNVLSPSRMRGGLRSAAFSERDVADELALSPLRVAYEAAVLLALDQTGTNRRVRPEC